MNATTTASKIHPEKTACRVVASWRRPDPPPQNRVWNFFGTTTDGTSENLSQVVDLHQEIFTTDTTTVSGVFEWRSKDPIGISGGLNQYVFVLNNPVNYVDPLGLVNITVEGDVNAIVGGQGIEGNLGIIFNPGVAAENDDAADFGLTGSIGTGMGFDIGVGGLIGIFRGDDPDDISGAYESYNFGALGANLSFLYDGAGEFQGITFGYAIGAEFGYSETSGVGGSWTIGDWIDFLRKKFPLGGRDKNNKRGCE